MREVKVRNQVLCKMLSKGECECIHVVLYTMYNLFIALSNVICHDDGH